MVRHLDVHGWMDENFKNITFRTNQSNDRRQYTLVFYSSSIIISMIETPYEYVDTSVKFTLKRI